MSHSSPTSCLIGYLPSHQFIWNIVWEDMGGADAAENSNICKCFLPEPFDLQEDVNFIFLGKLGGISIIKPLVNREHNSMANIEKMWLKIGFPHDLVVRVNWKLISNSPFPSHDGEL